MTKCEACFKTFTSSDDLRCHFTRQPTCEGWIKSGVNINQEKITECEPKPMSDELKNEEFVAPKYSLCHIIWNVFLMDKEYPKLPNFQEIIAENNIKYVVAILPEESVYDETMGKYQLDHTVMKYEGHDMTFDTQQFDEQCAKMEEHRKQRNNIFVYCNNGYQRSIPFLSYYLMKFHNTEAPSVERAIDLILPQVDRENYASLRSSYIESVTRLFAGIMHPPPSDA